MYELVVIGGGSGGLAASRRAAKYLPASSILVINSGPIGGTCVNVGCVPKKVWWQTSELARSMHLFDHYGFNRLSLKGPLDTDERLQLQWENSEMQKDYEKLMHDGRPHHIHKAPRYTEDQKKTATPEKGTEVKLDAEIHRQKMDDYLRRLHGSYYANLEREQISILQGKAKIEGEEEKEGTKVIRIRVNDETVYAKKVLIAVGGKPIIPEGLSGVETSDDFFQSWTLKDLPKQVAIVGAGYIAVELAGIIASLGSRVDLYIRGNTVLRSFDPLLQQSGHENLLKVGVLIHPHSNIKSQETVKEQNNERIKLTLEVNGKKVEKVVDKVLWAIGREPNTKELGLENLNLKLNSGYISTNENCETNHPNVYAIGDCTLSSPHLTPTAIMVGRNLCDKLFNPNTDIDEVLPKLIPTVIFSHPPMGTLGLSEPEAKGIHGDSVKIHISSFTPMKYALCPLGHPDRIQAHFKIITLGHNDLVVGIHIVGDHVDEILQGFAVAMNSGVLTKKLLNRTIAIHPTLAEELVTI